MIIKYHLLLFCLVQSSTEKESELRNRVSEKMMDRGAFNNAGHHQAGFHRQQQYSQQGQQLQGRSRTMSRDNSRERGDIRRDGNYSSSNLHRRR